MSCSPNASSLTVLYVIGVIIYASVTIGGLRTIVHPTEEDTESDRIEALRVLSAGNTLIILCLVGVLLLQVRQVYVCVYSLTDMFQGWTRIRTARSKST
jgi:ER membrane protein SH3